MGLSHLNRLYLKSEGIIRPNDLIDFTTYDHFKQIIDNCKCPARITDTNNIGKTIAQEDFQFPARYLMRLKLAAAAVEY